MKKLILGIAAIALAASASFAGDVSVGARAAANFGTLWGDNTEDVPWGFGFNAGIDAKIGLNDMFSVVPEVSVDLHRASDDDATLSTWALDIPVMARINVMPQLFVEVGPSFNFLLSSEWEIEMEDPFSGKTTTISQDIDDITNTFEFAIAAGLGFSVMPNLDINFRYAMALTSYLDQDDAVKHMQFQLGATFWFM